MGNVAASGGYWISMNADVIYADPSTITGSIGIFGLWLSTPDTLDKIGLHTGGVGTTRFAGAFDPTRPFDRAVGDIIQSVTDAGYADITGKVAEARARKSVVWGKRVAYGVDLGVSRIETKKQTTNKQKE